MRVNKIICDQCGKEKDLINIAFGYEAEPWQSIKVPDEHVHGGVQKDFCGMGCLVKYLNGTGKKDGDQCPTK